MESECDEPPKLPQEIFDLIIDQISLKMSVAPIVVDRRIRRALVNCSLVSRGFRARSLRHIFSRVLIEADAWPPVQDTSPDIKRWNDFLDIVDTNPAIATMVQTLTTQSLSSNSVEEQPAWIWTIPTLPRVLRSLTHIQAFSLDESGLEWNMLPLDVASALIECISCPSLCTLKMKEVYAFPLVHSSTAGLSHPWG
ncbi:hypothetical protein NLJ89_g11033 [Agrocybe chaxingu]|uniref:F-box domain-containing protein n=1 Tax=Agrocybe chaxingu TaxID=84603 RepID=A0A9W8JXJ1_9AGAR|nr:hypothetical protein NLJ89_g11033 [Agrocybe chaxingu]